MLFLAVQPTMEEASMPHRPYSDVTSARYRTFGKVSIPYIGCAEGQDPDASGTGEQGNNVDGSTSTWNMTHR